MKRLSYAAKVRLTTSAVLLVIVSFFGIIGYQSTHPLFALTPTPSGVYIFTDKVHYTIGQDITITIANTTSHAVSVINNCPQQPLSVYYLSRGSWRNITATTNAAKCNGEPAAYTIPANRSIQVDYSYWPQLFNKSGEYQIVANLVAHSGGTSTKFFVSQ